MVFTKCLGREGFGNPSTMASNNAAVDMDSMPTVEVINTYLARNQEEVVLRPK